MSRRWKSKEGLEALLELAKEQQTEPLELALNLLANYPPGLQLINQDSLQLTPEVWTDPEGYLNRLIKNNYIRMQTEPPSAPPASER